MFQCRTSIPFCSKQLLMRSCPYSLLLLFFHVSKRRSSALTMFHKLHTWCACRRRKVVVLVVQEPSEAIQGESWNLFFPLFRSRCYFDLVVKCKSSFSLSLSLSPCAWPSFSRCCSLKTDFIKLRNIVRRILRLSICERFGWVSLNWTIPTTARKKRMR